MELRKPRLVLIVFLIAFLIIYLFAAKIYLPGLIKREILKFNEEKGVQLNFQSATFDLFRGLVIKDVSLGNSVFIKKIEVLPSYIDSLISKNFTVEKLKLDGPRVRIDDELRQNVVKLQSGEKGNEDKKNKILIKLIFIKLKYFLILFINIHKIINFVIFHLYKLPISILFLHNLSILQIHF